MKQTEKDGLRKKLADALIPLETDKNYVTGKINELDQVILQLEQYISQLES